MGSDEIVTALVGLLGALVGAAAAYLGTVRAASRANRPAWASVAIDAARSLLTSEDPVRRAEGDRLLSAAAAALAGAPDAPEQLRAATRTEGTARALERAGDLARSAGSAPGFVVTAPLGRSALAPPSRDDDPALVLVSARDVDAARAEVRAFRAAGLVADPLVIALAGAAASPDGGR